MMRVVRSSVVSMWKRPPAVVSMVLPPRDHWMCRASPEKAQATVRILPGSMLMSSGKASILGAEPGDHIKPSSEKSLPGVRGRLVLVSGCVRQLEGVLPMALKDEPSRWEDVSPWLLELMA